MMVGKTDNMSDSFVNFKLTTPNGKDYDKGNVSSTVRGETLAERNGKLMENALKNPLGSDDYDVSISQQGKKLQALEKGSVVTIQTQYQWTREEELAALEDSVRRNQKMNETFQRIGVPIDPKEEQDRISGILSKSSQGTLDVSRTAEENGILVSAQNPEQVLKTPTGFESNATNNQEYIPVTEIRSKHYRWTEESGIEETLSKEAELEQVKNSIRKWMTEDINNTIDTILKPYETYEEAYDKLYGEETLSQSYSINEDIMAIDMRGKQGQGAFGVLANQLNNYLELFGKEDSYYDSLRSAFNQLDPDDTNGIVHQILSMIDTVGKGDAIKVDDQKFQEDVENAISAVYGGKGARKLDKEQKKDEKPANEAQQGLSFLEMQRRDAEQEGRLLDELLGKGHDSKVESAGDILARRKPEAADTELRDKLRHVDEREEPRKPFSFVTEKDSPKTEMPNEEIAKQKALHDAWHGISSKMFGDGDSTGKSVKTGESVDILA